MDESISGSVVLTQTPVLVIPRSARERTLYMSVDSATARVGFLATSLAPFFQGGGLNKEILFPAAHELWADALSGNPTLGFFVCLPGSI